MERLGFERGVVEGDRSLVLRQLTWRVGEIPPELHQQTNLKLLGQLRL